MRYLVAMKREDIIRDIHGLETEMAKLEQQYGLLSEDFYHFFQAGELEQTRDFIRWAGFYEAKKERENSYRQLEHPEIPALAPMFPHHKDVQPDLRDHRVPAPGISFESPNVDVVLEDIHRDWLPS